MRVRVFILAVLALVLFPGAASADYAHIVQPGETLTSVAQADGLSIAALAHANRISTQAKLIAGQTLWIPPKTSAATPATATTKTTATSSSGATAPDITSNPSPSNVVVSASGGPVPTAERVSAAEIATIADANGVPAALAEAIAWQESGWNNDEVSKIGAVGVMQITPSTWRWINNYLTPAYPLGSASATENVRAGVLFLQQLLSATHDNQRLTVAAYFQGLASIRKFGLFRSTKRYVANVEALSVRL